MPKGSTASRPSPNGNPLRSIKTITKSTTKTGSTKGFKGTVPGPAPRGTGKS